jgi:hypothetical protein
VTRYRDKIHTEMRHREVYETRDTGGKKLHRKGGGEKEIQGDTDKGRGCHLDIRAGIKKEGEKKIRSFR